MGNGRSCFRNSWIKNSNVTMPFFILLGVCRFLSLILQVDFLQVSGSKQVCREPLVYILTASKAERKEHFPTSSKCKNSREGP